MKLKQNPKLPWKQTIPGRCIFLGKYLINLEKFPNYF